MLGYAYHFSKFYAYIDIIPLVGQGFAVNSLMAFQHITAPFLTYSRIISMPSSFTGTVVSDWLTKSISFLPSTLAYALSSPDWRVFALANSIHHTIMYAYFSRIPGSNLLRHVIPITSWLQLALRISTEAVWILATNGGKDLDGGLERSDVSSPEVTNRVISVLLLVRYAMLQWEERAQYVLAEHKRQKKVEEKGKNN